MLAHIESTRDYRARRSADQRRCAQTGRHDARTTHRRSVITRLKSTNERAQRSDAAASRSRGAVESLVIPTAATNVAVQPIDIGETVNDRRDVPVVRA
jgi:hypothetical protein